MNITSSTQSSFLFIHLSPKCLFLIAASKPSAAWKHIVERKHPSARAQWDIMEANRAASAGAVLQTYTISAAPKTMNNSLLLLKTFIRQQNAGGSGLSYQPWQYGFAFLRKPSDMGTLDGTPPATHTSSLFYVRHGNNSIILLLQHQSAAKWK